MSDKTFLLPEPDAQGEYTFPDGSLILKAVDDPGKWTASWMASPGDQRLIADQPGTMRLFSSPDEAAEALRHFAASQGGVTP